MKNYLLFSLLLVTVFGSSCKVKTKGTDACGDGFVDPAEDCDGEDLNDETCASLGHYNLTGQLACDSTCRFDTSDCGSRCGDNVVDAEHGEECDGGNLNGMNCEALNFSLGGTLSCSAACRFDTSQCLTTCGNGNLEPGEDCDDGNADDGDGCSATCTVEEGWTCSGETVSTCTPICQPGLTYCGGDCLDLANDPGHCGGCTNPCDSGELCVGSVCRTPDAPWSRAARFPGGDESTRASRFAVTACDGGPVIWVHDYDEFTLIPFSNYQLNLSGEQMLSLTNLVPPVTNPDNNSFGGMDMTCQGDLKIAAYNLRSDHGVPLLKLDSNGQWNSHTGGVQLISPCSLMHHVQVISDKPNSVHVLTAGSGGCGTSVEYAWWDGSAWQGHPSMGNYPRQVSGNSMGQPALSVFNSSAVIALVENNQSNQEIQFWTWGSDSWIPAMPSLVFPDLLTDSVNVSIELVHAPDGRLCTAIHMARQPWETDPFSLIRVFCADPVSGQWHELADGMDPQKHNRAPSLTFAGDQLYMAFSQRQEVVIEAEPKEIWKARVVRWNPDALAWEAVARSLELDETQETRQLQLVNHQDQLVLFLLEVWHEQPDSTGNLYVWKP